MLGAKPLDPLYTAVMLCVPAPKADVAQVATAPVTVIVEQRVAAPSLKVTVPVPPGEGVIVAVNVTEPP